MYEPDRDQFIKIIRDLCIATGKKFSLDMPRVFFDDLRDVPLREVERMAMQIRRAGKRTWSSADLRAPPSDTDPHAPVHASAFDNPMRMSRIADYVFARLWPKLTPTQRIKPRTWLVDKQDMIVAMVISPDPDSNAPGYRVALEDAQMLDVPDMPEHVSARDKNFDKNFNEAQAVTDLLNRGKPQETT
jgi:hypothetical protein